jgi:hypothetical protein
MRCRFCYETGHNVKGCKKMKEIASTAAAKPAEDRSYNERYAMAKVEHHKQASKNRACSYCSGESHTRRTCASLKAHAATRNALEARWRRGIAKVFADSPVKIGAFVEWTTWQGGKITAIITGLNTEKLKENDFGVFGLDQYGVGAGRGWVNYTILSVGGERERYWGPQEGQIFAESPPTEINGRAIFKPNPFGREEEYYGTKINILSEGISSLEFPESWFDAADATVHLGTVKRVNIDSMDAKHDSLRSALEKVGF